jgi:DNA-binding NarL/FixJ family response regulator
MQKILLIQDDPADAAAVRQALVTSSDGPFQVEWVRLCSEGLVRLADGADPRTKHTLEFAAVLLDLFLPDSRGIDTFERIYQTAPQIPILVLISSDDEEIAKLAVQRGAQDFLLKSRLDNYWLPKALNSMVERAANGDALFREKERAEVTLNSAGRGRKPPAGRSRKYFKSSMPSPANPWRIPCPWRFGKIGPSASRRTASSSGATASRLPSKIPPHPSMTGAVRWSVP